MQATSPGHCYANMYDEIRKNVIRQLFLDRFFTHASQNNEEMTCLRISLQYLRTMMPKMFSL